MSAQAKLNPGNKRLIRTRIFNRSSTTIYPTLQPLGIPVLELLPKNEALSFIHDLSRLPSRARRYIESHINDYSGNKEKLNFAIGFIRKMKFYSNSRAALEINSEPLLENASLRKKGYRRTRSLSLVRKPCPSPYEEEDVKEEESRK